LKPVAEPFQNESQSAPQADDEAGEAPNEIDQRLLAQARSGDNPSLERLLERHQAQIYRFGMKMCRDPQAASDVLQETLLAMARQVRDFRGASSLSTWLYTIARNFCIKQRRRSKFAPTAERSLDTDLTAEVQQLADPAPTPDEALASRQLEQALDAAIGALAPMYREVLVLRDVEGLSAPEVAEVLGLSIQAVKTRLHRARQAVRGQLQSLLQDSAELPAAKGSCPDVLTLFSQHLEDEISPQMCADMEQHLQACERCRGKCDSLKRTLALCSTAGAEAQVPAAVQASVKTALRDLLVTGS
jgi:RNA polymerase sigma-70 factor, ECF subfamily